MCGLAFVVNSGEVGNLSGNLCDLFSDMLLASAVRGVDGTGVFQVEGNGKVWYGKTAQPSGAAVSHPHVSGVIKSVHKAVINVGHVRAATRGEVSDSNCHPFTSYRDDEKQSYIIGVHNGTLYGWETADDSKDHVVDSSWAFAQIAAKGVKAFEDFYGAFAMLWYDTLQPGKLFIARNLERPLYIARSKDKRTLIGASEAGMLRWVAERNKVEIEEGDIFSVDDGYLFSIDTSYAELSIELEETLPEDGFAYNQYYQPSTVNRMLPALPAPTATTTATSTASPAVDSIKLETIEAVKKALRGARYSKVEDEDTPFEAGPEEILLRADDDWFNASVVGEADRKRAMHDGSFGSIVTFTAVAHDNITQNVLGEIIHPTFYSRPITYLEDVSPFEWGAYENKDHIMVIAGVRYFGSEKEYVVVPLNDKGMEKLAA